MRTVLSPKSIKFNAILSSVKMVLSTLVSLVTFPYISRVLQVAAMGRHNFAVSVVSYFVMLAELGVTTYAVREGTRLRNNRIQLSRFVSEIFTLQSITAAISMLLLICAVFFVPKLQQYWLLLLILGLQIPLVAFGRSWLYNIQEEFGLATLTQFCFQLISVVLMFLLVRSPADLYTYTIIYLLSNAGANILYGLHSRKHVDVQFVSISSLKRHLKPILIIFSTNVTQAIYINSDVTILGWLVNDEAVGLYSIAVKVYTIVKQVISAVITVTIPRLTLYASTNQFKSFFNKVLNVLMLILLPATAGFYMLSENVVEIIAGAEYIAAASSMRLLSLALGASMFACLYASGCLIPNMQEKPVLLATLISSVANIALNFALIPLFHQDAAAFTTLIAELIVWGVCYFFAKKYAPFKGTGRNLPAAAIGCVSIVIVCLWIQSVGFNLYLETILCVGISVIAYCLVQLLCKNDIFLQLVKSVLNHFKSK